MLSNRTIIIDTFSFNNELYELYEFYPPFLLIDKNLIRCYHID